MALAGVLWIHFLHTKNEILSLKQEIDTKQHHFCRNSRMSLTINVIANLVSSDCNSKKSRSQYFFIHRTIIRINRWSLEACYFSHAIPSQLAFHFVSCLGCIYHSSEPSPGQVNFTVLTASLRKIHNKWVNRLCYFTEFIHKFYAHIDGSVNEQRLNTLQPNHFDGILCARQFICCHSCASRLNAFPFRVSSGNNFHYSWLLSTVTTTSFRFWNTVFSAIHSCMTFASKCDIGSSIYTSN